MPLICAILALGFFVALWEGAFRGLARLMTRLVPPLMPVADFAVRLHARTGAFDLRYQAPEPAELPLHREALASFSPGATFTLLGQTVENAALAIGKVLWRDVVQEIVPETEHDYIPLERYVGTWQVHGWRDARGRVRVFSRTSRKLLVGFSGEQGDEVLVVYDQKTLRHVVLSLTKGTGPVRTALRKTEAPHAAQPEPEPNVPRFTTAAPPFDPLTLRRIIAPGGLLQRAASLAATPPSATDPLTALHTAIAESLTDDRPRLVLADACLDTGDPRGEFIRLQIAEAVAPLDLNRRLKVQLLARDLGPQWAPPGTRALRFHRGVLQHAEWFAPTDPSHPAWVTLESLQCAEDALRGPSVFDRPRPALKSLTGLDAELARDLPAERLPALEQLEVGVRPGWLGDGLDALLQAFPRLRSLGLRFLPGAGAPTEEQLTRALQRCAGLERLQVSRTRVPLRVVRGLARRHAPKVRCEVAVEAGPLRAVLDLGLARLYPTWADEVAWEARPFVQDLQAELGSPISVWPRS